MVANRPQDGNYLGMGERGWGQSKTELTLGIVGVTAFIIVVLVKWIGLSLPDIKDLWKEFQDRMGRGVSQVGRGDR